LSSEASVPGSRIATKTAELLQRRLAIGSVASLCGGEETASELKTLCDAVTISGSLKAGRAAQEICAARHIPFQAELGGNNGSIVWADSDLRAAAEASRRRFCFAGQRCTANRRAHCRLECLRCFVDQLIWRLAAWSGATPQTRKRKLGRSFLPHPAIV